MNLSPEDISRRIKITNLFRLAKRLEQNSSKDQFFQFEKALNDYKPLSSQSESKQLEELYDQLKKKFSINLKTDSEELFGVKFNQTRKPEPVEDFSQHEIEKQILELARNMKQMAGNFSSTLTQDNTLLESIHSKQSSCMNDLKKEEKRLISISVKTSFFALFKSFFFAFISFPLFILMLSLIHFFPSTSYISLKDSR
jgi:hypothetical protein